MVDADSIFTAADDYSPDNFLDEQVFEVPICKLTNSIVACYICSKKTEFIRTRTITKIQQHTISTLWVSGFPDTPNQPIPK